MCLQRRDKTSCFDAFNICCVDCVSYPPKGISQKGRSREDVLPRPTSLKKTLENPRNLHDLRL